MEKLSLIDMSSDEDLLPPSQCDQDPTCSENNSGHEDVNPVKMSNQWDHIPKKSESPEQKRTKPVKVNLRKSLAWDNAFLTSEGVLNTEELGIVNSTFRKTEGCSLAAIPEDLRKSSESISTLDSDCYSLASLEGDLFNLRASIQMSVNRDDNTTSVEPASSCDYGKGNEVPKQKIKPPTAVRKVGMNKQQTEHSSNTGKKESDNSKMALKPPRMVPKSASSCTQLKINTKRTSSSGIASISKTSGDSGNITTPRSAGLPKPKPTTASTKSPLDNSRKRAPTRNTDNALSKLTSRTPTRTTNSRLSSSNNSCKISGRTSSPSSSTDSFASEASSSSTSVSTVKTSSNSSSPSLKKRASPVIKASVGVSTVAQTLKRDNPAKSSTAKASVSVSTVAETFKRDNLARASFSTSSTTGARSFIPTGLRMPSPKIGYFDSEKTQGNKPPQSDLRRSSSSMIKPRSTKIPSLKPTSTSTPRSSPICKQDTNLQTGPDSSVLDDDRVLEKMTALSISTEKGDTTQI